MVRLGLRGGILENFEEISANNTNTAGIREMIFLKVRNPNFKPASDEAIAQANMNSCQLCLAMVEE